MKNIYFDIGIGMEFKLGELFCGPGGLALGAALSEPIFSDKEEKYSISTVWGVDKGPL